MLAGAIPSLLLTSLLAYFGSCAETRTRLVIVGAGVSGIGAATRLLERGFQDFKILEAENRIGGRVYSTKLGDGATVDYGAHWVHGGKGNPVFELADPLGLVEESGDGGECTIVFSDGKALIVDMEHVNVEEYLEDTDTKGFRNVSMKELLYNISTKAEFKKIVPQEYMSSFVKGVERMQCILDGCEDLGDVSAGLADDYLMLNSSQTLGWKGRGYASIIDLLLKRHEKSVGPAVELGDRLQLNTEVEKIKVREDGGGVEVHTKSGQQLLADLVLVTVSVGVLKERQDTLFQPPLPTEKKDAINAIGLGTVDKIIIRFPYAWWTNDTSAFQFDWLDEDKKTYKGEYGWETEVVAMAREKWSPSTLTGWILGDAAREMEKTPIEGVRRATMRLLRKFLASNYTIPEPVEIIRSSWGTNPHFRGSYGYRRLEAERHNVSHIRTPLLDKNGKEVVFFGGEATHPYFFSTVHGALVSGWREAERILSRLSASI